MARVTVRPLVKASLTMTVLYKCAPFTMWREKLQPSFWLDSLQRPEPVWRFAMFAATWHRRTTLQLLNENSGFSLARRSYWFRFRTLTRSIIFKRSVKAPATHADTRGKAARGRYGGWTRRWHEWSTKAAYICLVHLSVFSFCALLSLGRLFQFVDLQLKK